MSGVLTAHGGQRGFGQGNGAKEVGLELLAEFFEFNVFGEPGDGKSSIVHEDIEAAVVANQRVNERRQGVEVGYVERTDIELGSDSCGGCGLIEALAAAEVAHGGDDAKASLSQFNGGEQSEAAGGTGDESDFVGHGSESTQCLTQEIAIASRRFGFFADLTGPVARRDGAARLRLRGTAGGGCLHMTQHSRQRC